MDSVEFEQSLGYQDSLLTAIEPGATRVEQKRFEPLLVVLEVAADAITVVLSSWLASAIYQWLQLGKRVQYESQTLLLVTLAFALMFVLLLDRDGAYQKGSSLLRIRETERVLRVSSTAFLLAMPIAFFMAKLFSRWLFLLAFLFVPLLLIAEKQLVFVAVRKLHEQGYGVRKVVIYGAGYTGRRVLSALGRSPKLGLRPVAIIDDDEELTGEQVFECSYTRDRAVPVIAGPVTERALRELGAEMLVVAIPALGRECFLRTLAESAAAGVRFAFVANQSLSSDVWTHCVDIDGLLLNSIAQPARNLPYEIAKRAFDVLLAAALLLTLWPMLLGIAVLVRVDSSGPALFRQKRVGRNGRLFDIYKFRTMYSTQAGSAFSPKEADDPRITRVGRVLRRTSLDELPQLINVLRGEMSLVGPRPEMPFITEQYGLREGQRLFVTPGITGLWQISADRAFLIHENLQYDLYYIRNRGFFMDLAILLHTALFAMRGV